MRQTMLLDVGPATGEHGMRGIGRYVRGLVDSLAEWPAEHQERVWAVGRAGETLRLFGARGIASRLSSVRPLDLGLLLGPATLGAAARRAGASVFHATDPHRPWGTRRVRQVVTAYDLIPLREASMLASWRADHRFAYRGYLNQIRSAAIVVAISRATATDLTELLGIPEDRIAIVSPVVDSPARSGRLLAPETPTFLFVGAVNSHKQPELAIEALARFREREGEGRLRFIGPSSEAQRADIRRHARSLGVLGSIQMDGQISDKELEAAFASATALLSLSQIEGFGLPPVEAVLRGVPVISVDIPSARETVADAATLVPPDAEAIAAAMAEPQPPSLEAQDRIRVRYSKRASAEALWAVYEPLLNHS